MKKMSSTFAIWGFLSIFTWAPVGMAADYPQNPIRMIVAYAAGGGTDVLARIFQSSFEKVLGQRVFIENIPAGSTKMATMALMKAKPDGYTLMFQPGISWVGSYYSDVFDYKPWERAVAIGNVTSEPYCLPTVRAESPFKTWADLVKAGKENPGKLTCGGTPAKGFMQAAAMSTAKAAGIETRFVGFAGGSLSEIALLGGHIDYRMGTLSESINMVRAGKTRALAISTAKRMEYLPDVPTFHELGIGGTVLISRSVYGPPGLPSGLTNTITKMVEKTTKEPEFIKLVQNLLHTVDYRTPEQTQQLVNNFEKEYGPMMKEMFK